MSETLEIIPCRSVCRSCGASAANDYQHAADCLINKPVKLRRLAEVKQQVAAFVAWQSMLEQDA